jgi:signal transduction histidine kinase
MDSSQTPSENMSTVGLESVISTAELTRRPTRPPNHAAENRALISLAREMVTSPESILQKLAETALTLCDAGSAGISLLEPDGAHFHWPAISGSWAAHVGGGTPREYGPCGTVLDRNAPQLMSHPERHFTYLAAVTPGIEEALLIPFYIDGKAVGTIWVIAHNTEHRFDAEDLRVMTNLGTFAAAAYQALASTARIRTAQSELQRSLGAQQELRSQAEETITRRTGDLTAANKALTIEVFDRAQAEATLIELSGRLMRVQDDERRRIARELHDSTGQVLAALGMNLNTMQLDSSSENYAKFAECINLISSASSEIRNLSYLLHPPLIDETGLRTAVEEYAHGFGKRSGLQITVGISKDIGRLEGNREIALFRVIQESLGNVHRHSGSPTASIRIFRLGQDVVLEITDQGCGLPSGSEGKLKSGVGIRSMHERLRPFGGDVSIKSTGSGTVVRAVLPHAPAIVTE